MTSNRVREFGRSNHGEGPLIRTPLGCRGIADSLQYEELGERYPASTTSVAVAFEDGLAGKDLRVFVRVASFPVTVAISIDSSVKAATNDQRSSHAGQLVRGGQAGACSCEPWRHRTRGQVSG